jgi:UDP-4-amino-4,6-dideoxy-N-acetyl-beta-L-altrosamine transaminase
MSERGPHDATQLPFLPYGRQCVDEDDIAAVAAALRSDFLTTGPLVPRFEAAFAEQTGARFAICCSSGTAGLHLATLTAGFGDGDGVVVPSVTFLATANAVRYVGAEVIFADVDPQSGLLTPETLQGAITRAAREGIRLRGVIPVHLKGVVADMAAIAAIADRNELLVIEDAAHALGSVYDNGTGIVGANRHARMTVFSTHPVKTLTTGEGGVVTTQSQELAKKLRQFRSHGMESDPSCWLAPDQGMDGGLPAPWYYEMAEIGFNYRLPDINCALGLAQLAKLERFLARRAELVAAYDALLVPLFPLVSPPWRAADGRPGWHIYGVQIDFAAAGLSRADLMRRLRSDGIGTQVHYVPVHTQPYYRRRYGALDLPGADSFYRGTLALPLFPTMAADDVARVVDRLTWHLRHP